MVSIYFTIGQLQCILASHWTTLLYDVIFWCQFELSHFTAILGEKLEEKISFFFRGPVPPCWPVNHNSNLFNFSLIYINVFLLHFLALFSHFFNWQISFVYFPRMEHEAMGLSLEPRGHLNASANSDEYITIPSIL